MSREIPEQARTRRARPAIARLGTVRGAAVRERLLEAARDVMIERGFFDATLPAIAERAGVPEATIRRHFASEYDLCLAVLVDALPDHRR